MRLPRLGFSVTPGLAFAASLGVAGLVAAAAAISASVAGATISHGSTVATAPVNIGAAGDLHESVWQADNMTKLRPGVTYRASGFPTPLRLRAPDGLWEGAQARSGTFRFLLLLHNKSGTVPLHGRGYLTLETSTGTTPSVATTIHHLRSTPGLDAGAVTSVRVAGFPGKSFDATVTGEDPGLYDRGAAHGVSLAPFTTNRHCAYCSATMNGETQDYKFAARGESLRIIAVNVRGRTVVFYLESAGGTRRYPEAKNFATFLPYAQRMLATVRLLP